MPAAPSGLTTGTGSSSTGDLFVVAQWRDNSDNEDGFRVHVADASYQTIDMFGIAPNSTQYSLRAQPGVVYCFRVQAFNSAGYSEWTSWACRSIEPVPAAPSNVSVTAISHDTVRIVWTDNSTNETGFRVRRLVHGELILHSLPANTTSYDWSGLPPATQVCFQVIAQGYGGPSPGVPGAPGACTTTLAAPDGG